MAKYSSPEVLVETDWVKQNLGKAGIKLVEIDVDTKAYDGSWTEYGNLVAAPIEK